MEGDAPRVEVPHPTAGIGEVGMRRVARQISAQVLTALAVQATILPVLSGRV